MHVTCNDAVSITSDRDIVRAREKGRALAQVLGFKRTDAIQVMTAVSELARNILHHACSGQVAVRPVREPGRTGILIVAQDDGPGMADVGMAQREGYSTSGASGLGLPVTGRAMDQLKIESRVGWGTTVTAMKWAL